MLDLPEGRLEFIGARPKSKITTVGKFDGTPAQHQAFNETLEARMKLATEEQNIRYARFEQEPYPAIFLLGDLNDALFDFPDHLRWTVHFRDPIEKDRNPKILLDHILFTQAIVADHSPLPFRIHSGAGKVEHLIFDELMPCSP